MERDEILALLAKYPESDWYTGLTEDGIKTVLIRRQKGHGMDLLYSSHDGWFEGYSYKEDGSIDSHLVEQIGDFSEQGKGQAGLVSGNCSEP